MLRWFFDNYGEFEGRAGRKEFWLFVLGCNVVSLILLWITSSTYVYIYSAIILIPTLAVSVRRLHDTGNSGWLVLLWLVPLLGQLVLIYFWCLPGEYEENQYGYPRD